MNMNSSFRESEAWDRHRRFHGPKRFHVVVSVPGLPEFTFSFTAGVKGLRKELISRYAGKRVKVWIYTGPSSDPKDRQRWGRFDPKNSTVFDLLGRTV